MHRLAGKVSGILIHCAIGHCHSSKEHAGSSLLVYTVLTVSSSFCITGNMVGIGERVLGGNTLTVYIGMEKRNLEENKDIQTNFK